MIEPLPPTVFAREIAAQMGGVKPLIADLLAKHGPSWPAKDGLAHSVNDWCDRSDYTYVSGPVWDALRTMMLAEWRAAIAYA